LNNSYLRILFVNLTVFLCLIFALELLFGEWLKFNPKVRSIPAALWGVSHKYDVSGLYRDGGIVHYSRDALGYRGFDLDSRPILLTIGGSTTDQRFVSDKDTWQSILEAELENKFNVVNAGVDGQSTFGHLVSIRDWHSNELRDAKLRSVLYYFGVNDGRLLTKGGIGLNEYDNLYANATILQKVRIAFSRNSFFYSQIRQVMKNLLSKPGALIGSNFWAGHQSGITFHETGFPVSFKSPEDRPGFSYYTELIKSLVIETRQAFPGASIILVQQQVPGCRFLSLYKAYDRYPTESKWDDGSSFCALLGQIFLAQDIAISELPVELRPSIVKMYTETVITEVGVYDGVHTNPLGSELIGKWLATRIISHVGEIR
jgi:hypothetical protein